jgi:NADH:ubiquinone oxidoreductase subunit D
LDKTTNDKEKIKKEESAENPDFLRLSVDPEREKAVEELLNSLEKSRTSIITATYKRYNSFLSDKRLWNHIMSLINASHDLARWSVVSAYATEYQTKRLDTLEKVVALLIDKLDADLPNVKAEIEKVKATVNSEAFSTVSEFVQGMRKKIDEYNRKMEKNDLAE